MPDVICGNNSASKGALDLLNTEKAQEFTPVVVVLGFLMVIGIIGNILVCYIYHFRFKRTSANYFITWLAILDLISCFLGVPFEIMDLLEPYNFQLYFACKIMRFTSSSTVIASGLTLVAVAFDRYYKIAKPLRRFPNRTAKILNVCALVIGLLMALPAWFVFGRKRITICRKNSTIIGYECSLDDYANKTVVPVVYFCLLALLFAFCVFSFIILYGRLGRTIMARKNSVIGERLREQQLNMRKESDSGGLATRRSEKREREQEKLVPGESNKCKTKETANRDGAMDQPNPSNRSGEMVQHEQNAAYAKPSVSSQRDTSPKDHRLNSDTPKTPNQTVTSNPVGDADSKRKGSMGIARADSRAKRSGSDHSAREHDPTRQHSRTGSATIRTGRLTGIFICVSVVFVISFLPYVIVKIVSLFVKNVSENLAYNFATRSFFLNSAANPLIYSFLNENFRGECCLVLKKVRRVCWF